MILIDPDAHLPRAALPKRDISRFLVDAAQRVRLQGEVTVLLSTDDRLRELNRTYRRQDKATDVLSFPSAPPTFAGSDTIGGDLAISLETAARQARNYEHPLAVEVKILILHGLLHLAGFDHQKDTGQMARQESKLRRHYQLPLGLIQRSSQKAAKSLLPPADSTRKARAKNAAAPRTVPRAKRTVPQAKRTSGQASTP